MHVRWMVLLSAFTLAACTLPLPPPSSNGSPSLTGATMMTESEGDTAAVNGMDVSPAALTGSTLPERLLPSGILEIGDPDALHSLFLVTEQHCRYCPEIFSQHIPALAEQFVVPGNLRISIVLLHLKKYAGSADAAAAMLCSAKQGKGLAMHQMLFERSNRDRSSLIAFAKELKLDEKEFGICLSDQRTAEILAMQQSWLQGLGVALVPTYFIDGTRYTGLPYSADLLGQVRQALDEGL